MYIQDLNEHLLRIEEVEIAVIGDFCLDTYYTIDFSHSEFSIETGQQTRPVRHMKFSLGGASNVANNIVDLNVRNVYALGVVGNDCYGKELFSLFDKKKINRDYMQIQNQDWDTHVYTKIIDGKEELERFDFGTFNQLKEKTMTALLDAIRELAWRVKFFVVNQQFKNGIHTAAFREALRKIMTEYPDVTFIVDCRDYNAEYPDAIHKLNNIEGAVLCHMEDTENPSMKQATEVARALYDKWGKPVFLTRGERGCLVCGDNNRHEHIPGFEITSKVDTVGAGDSMLAGIITSLAAGSSLPEAAEFGNMVAGITIQKLFQTGTATPDEIREFAADANYSYNHEIAESLYSASYYKDSEIEIVSGRTPQKPFVYAVFDHDGTLSVLRQGWEKIMESVMVKAITDEWLNDISTTELNKITGNVRSFIDRTTGIQTLLQMQGLVKMVKEYGFVPKEDILDEFGYKSIYNEALMEMVNRRINKVKKGELSLEDVTIKGVLPLLEYLRENGFTLFLASGTDEEDVQKETELLGYCEYFNGGIWGAQNNMTHEPKKVVINNIIKEIGKGHAGKILTFGDGPVEIRETVKNGGYAVGVASNEIQRFGLDETKRKRLILAGADLIIPDYSQFNLLKQVIF